MSNLLNFWGFKNSYKIYGCYSKLQKAILAVKKNLMFSKNNSLNMLIFTYQFLSSYSLHLKILGGVNDHPLKLHDFQLNQLLLQTPLLQMALWCWPACWQVQSRSVWEIEFYQWNICETVCNETNDYLRPFFHDIIFIWKLSGMYLFCSLCFHAKWWKRDWYLKMLER